MKEIYLKRYWFTEKSTIGELYYDSLDKRECYVLEDKVREAGVKVYGETAIPAGEYKVVVNFSNHMKKQLPQILNVPGFEGIRIHSGNTDKDTEGCLLVGEKWTSGDLIIGSRAAFSKLFPKILEAVTLKKDISILIQDK